MDIITVIGYYANNIFPRTYSQKDIKKFTN